MNTLLLQPTDVLFFRDGRPMGGSAAGHGAAWPLPSVINAALHAALWRSGLEGHRHDHRSRRAVVATDGRKFGSLVTAGPFPVGPDGRWYFPRPLDLGGKDLTPTLHPAHSIGSSSLPSPLSLPVVSSTPPAKERPGKAWLSTAAYETYLQGGRPEPADAGTASNADFSDTETTIGIGIDAETQTQDGTRFYSAHYLRLREGWRMGVVAATAEKIGEGREDLVPRLISNSHHIVVGGQQRVCTAHTSPGPLKLPRGITRYHAGSDGQVGVKWVLLSPAVFPAMDAAEAEHPGGWLPSWVRSVDGAVQLRVPSEPRGLREPRDRWRARVQTQPMIAATLVAALIPKPIPITGWALGDGATTAEAGQSVIASGAKPTLLAVPAGAVYYFRCANSTAADALAAALNWHGNGAANAVICNRRSTLLGEKGFGLGVCGTWPQLPSNPA